MHNASQQPDYMVPQPVTVYSFFPYVGLFMSTAQVTEPQIMK